VRVDLLTDVAKVAEVIHEVVVVSGDRVNADLAVLRGTDIR
jgi:hypothetical protein